jgi:hypothetical protein
MFQVGDKVIRLQTEGIQVVPAGTIGEITFVSKSSTQIKFEDWKGATDGQRNQSYGNAEAYVEKVEVKNTVKTWEMLRDIKVGEFWTNQNGSTVVMHVRAKGLLWESSDLPVVFTNTMLETYEWTKQPKFVDFAEAWDAYENGKAIRPWAYTHTLKKAETRYDTFTSAQIRGKWEVLD